MARKLSDMLASRSTKSRDRIEKTADKMLIEVKIQAVREELAMSQAELAAAMGISQPSVAALEQRGADMKISSMKRYVEAAGGKMRIDIELPTGKHIGFNF
ncbi:transcriptional regulator [Oceanisphaera profunda]|uniref:Transcriptional regulator n=1 Tax=Oceanisphaera profunda TaxID=1416627 RepID=A0A1Y0D732_9GAMM|nr:helix-turn-helix domain-containing protein [Oceanisphaera profunda]ART83330.1 transcriptional regulator [Oceanisphaera profunda]